MTAEPASSPKTEFDSRAEIDYLLAGLPQNRVSIVTLYQALVRAEVDVVVRRREGDERSREALVLSDPRYGRLAAVFTEPGLAQRWIDKLAPAPHEIFPRLGGEVIALLDREVGLWLNPEGRRGCRIASTALERLRTDFGVQLPEDGAPSEIPRPPESGFPSGHA